MAAAKPSRTAKPAAKAAAAKAQPKAAAKAAASAGKQAAKPAAKAATKAPAKAAAKPATKAATRAATLDQQAKAAQATLRRAQAEGKQADKAKHEEALAARFARGHKVAQMIHAKELGHLAGKAAAMGMSIEQYQQQKLEQQAQQVAAQNQAMAQLRQEQKAG
jgi:hypothetical protein